MGHERDDNQSGGTEDRSAEQQPTGQQGEQPTDQQNERQPTGQQGQQPTGEQGQSSSGQTQPSGGSDTLTSDQGPGAGTTSSGGSAGGFVGSKGPDSDEHVEQRESASNDSGGTDFANQGRGATEGSANESDSGDGESNPT